MPVCRTHLYKYGLLGAKMIKVHVQKAQRRMLADASIPSGPTLKNLGAHLLNYRWTCSQNSIENVANGLARMPEFSKSIQETRGNRFMENLANHIMYISSYPVADVQRKPPNKKEEKKKEDNEDGKENEQLTERSELGAPKNPAVAECESKRNREDLSTFDLEMEYLSKHLEHLGNRDQKLLQELEDVSKQLVRRQFSSPLPRTISLFIIISFIILIFSFYLKVMQCIKKPDENCY
jgi:hypothetical protein